LRSPVVGLRPTSGAPASGARSAARSHARRPVKVGGYSETEKGVECCPQVGNSLWTRPFPGKDRARPYPRWSGWVPDEGAHAGRRWPVSPMEGTSGAADPVLLRGSAGDAALGPGSRRAQARLDTCRCGAPMRKRGATCRACRANGWVRGPLPFAGVGLAWWDRRRRGSLKREASLASSESPAGGAAVS